VPQTRGEVALRVDSSCFGLVRVRLARTDIHADEHEIDLAGAVRERRSECTPHTQKCAADRGKVLLTSEIARARENETAAL
jgi:hypothetical protein